MLGRIVRIAAAPWKRVAIMESPLGVGCLDFRLV